MAKLLPIIINPDPILRKKSLPVANDDIATKKMQVLFADMSKTMIEKDGVGLAAPQIGKNIRIITISTKDGTICMANPKITRKSWAKEWNEEGCLSVPGVFGKVSRHKKVNCIYTDKDGKKTKIEASGLMAFVIQHEIDHLDGVLFIDKAKDIKKIEI